MNVPTLTPQPRLSSPGGGSCPCKSSGLSVAGRPGPTSTARADELTRHDQAAGIYDEPLHETPIPCYEDDVSRCGCSTCINEPKIPGKRPITEAQRRDRFLTPNVHPPKFTMRHADGCACGRTDNHGPHED